MDIDSFLPGGEHRSELRERLRRLRNLREQAEQARTQAATELQSVVIEAYGVLSVVEIARLAGVSRRAVYNAWADVEPYLE